MQKLKQLIETRNEKNESKGLHNGSSFTVLAFTGGRKLRSLIDSFGSHVIWILLMPSKLEGTTWLWQP